MDDRAPTPAAVPRPQQRHARLAQEHGRGEVRLDRGIPVRQLEVLEPGSGADGAGDGGVVDEHVEPAVEEGGGGGDGGGDGGLVTEIGLRGVEGVRVVDGLEVRGNGVLQLGLVAVEEENAVAFGEEEAREAAL